MEPEGTAPPADEAAGAGSPWRAALLFAATVGTTLLSGGVLSSGWGPEPEGLLELFEAGVPFAASLLGILVAHEMGHFLTARWHGVDASLPYFIPGPPPAGTFGAVIRMRGRIPTRNALVDIGASGPLAGALVAIPVLLYGLTLSRIETLEVEPNLLFGNYSIVHQVSSWVRGVSPYHFEEIRSMEPQPLLYVLLKWLWLDVSGARDVSVHPVAFAGVIGLFVTALNLIPIGQLDGGHVAYAVLGRNAERLGKAFVGVMLAMALFSSFTWLVWVVLTRFFVGYGHPPIDGDEPLSPLRKAIVAATVLLFLLTLTPVAADRL